MAAQLSTTQLQNQKWEQVLLKHSEFIVISQVKYTPVRYTSVPIRFGATPGHNV